MKVLIAVFCLVAVASAVYVDSAYNYPLVHAEHVSVSGPKGVPLEEPAVAHTRAEHATAHAEAHARNGDGYGYADHVAAPVVYASHYEGHYTGPQHIPVINHKGVPVDTPAVQAARAHHTPTFEKIQARNADSYGYDAHVAAPVAYASHYVGHYTGPQHIPVINHKGVPVDTPAVQSARAHQVAAFAKVQSRSGHYAAAGGVEYAGHYTYTGPQHIPVIGHNGVPVDEPAVAHARAEHAAAHAKASAYNGDSHYAHPIVHTW